MTDRDTLHFLTCGHVDDGKSTLIGRLLYDIGAIPEDQLRGAMTDEGVIDYSRLTDGLEDERTQGITIDAAYRYFRYNGRHYRIADTPGHQQYVRNMAVAAANSDSVLVLVDAPHGIREQTLRHSRIAAFFGIRSFLVAVNKMDLAGYDRARFEQIEKDYRAALSHVDGITIRCIPVSALHGDNLTSRSTKMPWYKGPSVLDALTALEVPAPPAFGVRLPVQSVIRTDDHRRGYQGMLSGGHIRLGDQLGVTDTSETIVVSTIYHSGHAVEQAAPGEAITVLTEQDVDLHRGSVLFAQSAPLEPADMFIADVLWLDPAFSHRDSVQCMMKIYHREEQVEVQVEKTSAEIVEAKIFTAAPLVADSYERNRAMGLFLLIEAESEKVIGIGTVKSVRGGDLNFAI